MVWLKIDEPFTIPFNTTKMTTAFMIPFDKILEKSFELRETNPDMSIDEILKEVMPTINIQIQSDIPTNIRKKTSKKSDDSNSVDSGSKKSGKTELTDEERCMARTVYEDIHLDKSSGTLKVMRDDPKNLYGDRCKCRHKEGGKFCTRHSGFQPLGVWNSIYYGKLLDYVEKTQNPEPECLIQDVPTKKTPKKEKSEKKEKVEKTEKKEKSKKKETELEMIINDNDEDSVDAEPITIDGKDYYIDSENNLYSEDGDLVGIYNKKNNTIITGNE